MTWNSIQSGYVLYCARDGCKGYVLYVSVCMYYREGKREQRDAICKGSDYEREREVCNILKTLLKFCVHKKRRKAQVQIVTKATPQCKRLPPFV